MARHIPYATPQMKAMNGWEIVSIGLQASAASLAVSGGLHLVPWPIVLLALPMSIAGIVLGVIGSRRTRDPGVGRRRREVAEILVGASCFILILTIILPWPPTRDGSPRVYCANNMRQIGLAAIMYANDNQGHLPDDLGTLVAASDLVPAVCQCPSVEHDQNPPAGLAGAALAAWVNANTDYVYLGWGRLAKDDPQTVILYELPRDHGGAGANVLFLDAHVDWITAAKLPALSKPAAPPPADCAPA